MAYLLYCNFHGDTFIIYPIYKIFFFLEKKKYIPPRSHLLTTFDCCGQLNQYNILSSSRMMRLASLSDVIFCCAAYDLIFRDVNDIPNNYFDVIYLNNVIFGVCIKAHSFYLFESILISIVFSRIKYFR